jgi:hypothetical protein
VAASLRAWWSGSSVPSAADMRDVLGKVRRLRARFPADVTRATAHDMPRLALIDAEIVQIATAAGVDASGAIDAATWAAIPDTERRRLAASAAQLFDELRCLRGPEQTIGRNSFLIFVALFVVVTAAYAVSHRAQWSARDRGRPAATDETAPTAVEGVTADQISAAVRDLTVLELEASAQRAGARGDADRERAVEALSAAVDNLARDVEGVDLSLSTLQVLATVDAEARHGALLQSTDSVSKLRPLLLADLEAQRRGFFWSDRVWRWFEIAWWAEIGVLVGILFYMAGLLGEGRFEPEKSAMFVAEAVIAPVVVPVIFFLLMLTGLIATAPTATSLAGQLGVAFVIGFAVRRTVGLLDTVKKKVLPDPAP